MFEDMKAKEVKSYGMISIRICGQNKLPRNFPVPIESVIKNQKAIGLTNALVQFKTNILEGMLQCKLRSQSLLKNFKQVKTGFTAVASEPPPPTFHVEVGASS
ncbi:hypothetical protein [Paradesulfitobacterium aromaticivorans]